MERMRISGDKIKHTRQMKDRRLLSDQHRWSSHRLTSGYRRRDWRSRNRPRSYDEEKRSNEVTGRMLYSIMIDTKTDFQPLPGYGYKTADIMQRIKAGVDCDEVYPNVFIGNSGAARNKAYLRLLEVSHILNCAAGHGEVETGEEFYKDMGMRYLGLSLADDSSADLERHLGSSSEFIDHALLSGGRVMVNCVMGMSRSCAVVLGFLMLRRGLGAREAVMAVRRRRNVRPNGGFLHQLARLDNKLSRERGIQLIQSNSTSHRNERKREMKDTKSEKRYRSPHRSRVHRSPLKHRHDRS